MLRETIKISVHGEEIDPKTVASEISKGFFDFGLVYKSTLWVLLTIFLGGVVAFVVKSLDGGIQHNERYDWGYFSAISAFVSAIAPSFLWQLDQHHWSRPHFASQKTTGEDLSPELPNYMLWSAYSWYFSTYLSLSCYRPSKAGKQFGSQTNSREYQCGGIFSVYYFSQLMALPY